MKKMKKQQQKSEIIEFIEEGNFEAAYDLVQLDFLQTGENHLVYSEYDIKDQDKVQALVNSTIPALIEYLDPSKFYQIQMITEYLLNKVLYDRKIRYNTNTGTFNKSIDLCTFEKQLNQKIEDLKSNEEYDLLNIIYIKTWFMEYFIFMEYQMFFNHSHYQITCTNKLIK